MLVAVAALLIAVLGAAVIGPTRSGNETPRNN